MNTRDDLHAARLANLEDDPPDLGETLEAYLARMIDRHGSTYEAAATERHRGHAQREARAEDAARHELARLMRPGKAP